MADPLCKELYAILIVLQSFWLKQNFFDKKDFDCNYGLIYPTFFCWLLHFLLLATVKI